eukprot:gnl/TRDRNA2_/TRDRNA2_196178_c0_seq1.p1 gnl/TRDRNA2_/TRDRNA2_196178_c0~~gnl/TRDRNA2_/TRDRNA2_196178_c0_seq1.p1  ORF type:complete len:339 (+),score=44.08 gnl/TRDRNA2_/TRDRNA2_196178_c0_seq1:284-1300(+)
MATPPDLYCTPCPGYMPNAGPLSGELENEWTNPDPTHPLYSQVNGFGASEVIIESPKHNGLLAILPGEHVAHVLRVLASRGRALRSHPTARQMVYFKQYGKRAGGSLPHPHMQVHSLPIVPGYMRGRLRQHERFFREHGCCAVARLYVDDVTEAGNPASSRFIRESVHFVVSVPYAAGPNGRFVIAPKRHFQRFEDCTEEELLDLGPLLQLVMAAVYRIHDDPAYYIYMETAPTDAGIRDLDCASFEQAFRWTLHVKRVHNKLGITLASGVDLTGELPEDNAIKYRAAIDTELLSPLRDEPQDPSMRLLHLREELSALEKEVEKRRQQIEKLETGCAS